MRKHWRPEVARDIARIIVQTADVDAAIRIAKKIVASSDNTATMCIAAILVLAAIPSRPGAPPGTEDAWIEAVQIMLRAEGRHLDA